MGFVLIIFLIFWVVAFIYAFGRVNANWKVKAIYGILALMCFVVLVLYYSPFPLELLQNPVYQIQTDEELIWVEDEEEKENITSLLENLRFRRETIPTNDVLPVDQVTKYPIQADEWVMIMIYDGDTEINGMPNRIGGFYFAIPYPQVSRYISFDDNPLTNYRILNADEHMEHIKIILEKYLAS